MPNYRVKTVTLTVFAFFIILTYKKAPEVNPDDPNYDPLTDPNVVFDSVEFERTDEEICLGLDAAIREYLANAQVWGHFTQLI